MVSCTHVFFFQAEDGIRDLTVTGVQTCALPICEPAVDEPSGGAVLLDGAGEVLPEAGVEEVVVVADLEAGLGEEVGEISLQVLVQTLKAGKVAVSRHFALLHFSATPRSPLGNAAA